MAYAYDQGEPNELHASERDEERSARRRLSELDRVAACGHYWPPSGTCPHCGTEAGADNPHDDE